MPDSPPPPAVAEIGTVSSIRVLLVEDNPSDARLAQVALRAMPGADVVVETVARFADAVASLAADRADVVLLDLSLPDSSGIETVERMRAEAPDVPIVVLTGHDDETAALATLEAGAQDYIEKSRLDGYVLDRALRYARERHRLSRQLRELAAIDELTGVRNRRGFLALAEHHLALADRSNEPVALFYVDLDRMKAINDTYGHPEGDRALCTVAALLIQTYRLSDVIGRMGGDEFCVLLTGGGHDTQTAIARLHEAVDEFNGSSPLPYAVSLSIGAAEYRPSERCSVGELLRRADAAMYEQKLRRRPD
jgi:two-component system cell cycle response regulator